MVLAVVDCLGKTVNPAFSLSLTENSDTAETMVRACTPVTPQSATLMSDGGSAFAKLAITLGLPHVLCTHHYQENAVKNSGGLSEASRNMFLKGVNSLIFDDFGTEALFMEKYNSVLSGVTGHSNPTKFLNGLFEERSKICRFYTKEIFTCGHNATVRCESSNSRIKGGGELKRELRDADLIGCTEQIVGCFERQEQESLKMLRELIMANKQWSDHVDKKWKASLVIASAYTSIEIIEETPEFTIYLVTSVSQSTEHRIYISKDGCAPTCLCGFFKSNRIPCAGICAVFCRIESALFLESNLVPRWRLSSHPLYRTAHEQLGMALPEEHRQSHTRDTANSESENMNPMQLVAKEAMKKIKYPKSSKARHGQLNERFKTISQLATTEAEYKWTMCQLSAMENQLQKMREHSHGGTIVTSSSTDLSDQLPAVRPPLAGKERKREEDLINHANRNSKKKK